MNEKYLKVLLKPIWKIWYGIVSKRDKEREVRFMNYGYHGENRPELHQQDENERYPIQLYDYLASFIDVKGKKILEVGCGRGGGSSYITRYLKPLSYHAIDLSDEAIQFCQTTYDHDNLTHLQGDAQNLPFEDSSFDVVMNVESSHCYPDISVFFSEVKRVLRPGGVFLYTDLRNETNIQFLKARLSETNFRIKKHEDITSNVFEALKLDSNRREHIIKKIAPGFLHPIANIFAGVKNSKTYKLFENRWYHYFLYVLEKV